MDHAIKDIGIQLSDSYSMGQISMGNCRILWDINSRGVRQRCQ